MTQREAQEILDKIVGQVFGFKNPMSLDQFMQKFTFDVKLPQQVNDTYDGSLTWAQSTNPLKFMKMANARGIEIGGASQATDWLRPSRSLNDIDDIMAAWNEINFTTTERLNDCINVSESDNIEFSENIFRSQDIRRSKNIVLSDSLGGCEYMAASQRCRDSVFSIRVEDSGECSNCFSISWCGRITNSFFIHDASDMQDSMFCTNIMGKRFCIANMQYDETEYKRLRDIVARWILTG